MKAKVCAIAVAVFLVHPYASSGQTCVPPPSNLVSWWPGDSHTQDIADGNHGFLQGAPTYEAGMVSAAFRIPRVTKDHIAVPDSPGLNITGDLTIEAWISLSEVDQLGTSWNDRGIINKGFSSRTYSFWVEGEAAGAQPGMAPLRYALSNAQSVDSDILGWVEDEWHHVAVVRSGTQITFYRDGASVGVRTLNVTYSPSPGDSVYIGGFKTCCGLRGRIDEVGLYDGALSGPEIESIYQAGSSGKCGPEVATEPTTWGTIKAIYR